MKKAFFCNLWRYQLPDVPGSVPIRDRVCRQYSRAAIARFWRVGDVARHGNHHQLLAAQRFRRTTQRDGPQGVQESIDHVLFPRRWSAVRTSLRPTPFCS